MSTSWVVEVIVALSLCANAFSMAGFDFVIMSDPENSDETPRALLTAANGIPFSHMPQNAFTFCLFVNLENSPSLLTTLVSYSSQEAYEYNEVYFEVCYKNNYTALSIHDGSVAIFNKVPAHKQWTHLCTSWKRNSGKVRLFMDGKEVKAEESTTAVHLGKTIGGNGYLVLGQDQDEFNGGYDPWQGVKGKISQFNVWDRELSSIEVNKVMKCLNSGKTVGWFNSTWEFSDGIRLQPSTAPCSFSCGQSGSRRGATIKGKDEPTKNTKEEPIKRLKTPEEDGWSQKRRSDGQGGWIKEYVWQKKPGKIGPLKDPFNTRKIPDGKGGWVIEYVFNG